MNTYEIKQTLVNIYYVEAKSDAEALQKVDNQEIEPDEQTEIALKITDVHNGKDWAVEPAYEGKL